ncbi:MAG TPA: STAS domain-containing protein [Mycobacteriales bacterium]|nr:STAS domain-containing protein [Mycobacteriales bacterium]
MRTWVSPSRAQIVVTPRGELDIALAPGVTGAIRQVLDDTPEAQSLVLDLGDVTFIDSSGVKVVVLARRLLAERGGQLVVCNAQPRVHRVLALLGIGSLTTVHPVPEDLPTVTDITDAPAVSRQV